MAPLPSRVTSCPSSRTAPSVGSIKRSTVRATVDLPQPLSPTRPSVSPSPTENVTLSTACTWPTVRRNSPFLTGKYFFRLSTSSTGGRLCRAAAEVADPSRVTMSAIEPLGMPAGGPVAGALLLVGWIERPAMVIGIGTARRERAARRQVGQGRHHAGNLLQPPVGGAGGVAADHRQMRDRGEEPVRVGVHRRTKQVFDIGLFDLFAGI